MGKTLRCSGHKMLQCIFSSESPSVHTIRAFGQVLAATSQGNCNFPSSSILQNSKRVLGVGRRTAAADHAKLRERLLVTSLTCDLLGVHYRQWSQSWAMSTNEHLVASAAHCSQPRHLGLPSICRAKAGDGYDRVWGDGRLVCQRARRLRKMRFRDEERTENVTGTPAPDQEKHADS